MFDQNGVGQQALQLLFALYLYNYIMGQYVDPVRQKQRVTLNTQAIIFVLIRHRVTYSFTIFSHHIFFLFVTRYKINCRTDRTNLLLSRTVHTLQCPIGYLYIASVISKRRITSLQLIRNKSGENTQTSIILCIYQPNNQLSIINSQENKFALNTLLVHLFSQTEHLFNRQFSEEQSDKMHYKCWMIILALSITTMYLLAGEIPASLSPFKAPDPLLIGYCPEPSKGQIQTGEDEGKNFTTTTTVTVTTTPTPYAGPSSLLPPKTENGLAMKVYQEINLGTGLSFASLLGFAWLFFRNRGDALII